MNLKFWRKTNAVCAECGMHFEPVTGYEARWGNLCKAHREPVRERDEQKDAVMEWASNRWVELAEQMNKERADLAAAYNAASAASMQNLANAQSNACGQQLRDVAASMGRQK